MISILPWRAGPQSNFHKLDRRIVKEYKGEFRGFWASNSGGNAWLEGYLGEHKCFQGRCRGDCSMYIVECKICKNREKYVKTGILRVNGMVPVGRM